jgi:glycosyltransferase involved in cell wall biosynthesis
MKTSTGDRLRQDGIPTAVGGSAVIGHTPKVLIIGGEDVDARIELMRGLAGAYTPAAAGTSAAAAAAFARAGFPYFGYPLSGGVDPLTDARALCSLWRVLRAFRPRIVHAFDTKPGVYGCLAAALAGVPAVVGTVTGLGSLYSDDGRGRRAVRAVYENLQRCASHLSDRTIFQNQQDLQEFIARRVVSPGKGVLIPGSGVRTDLLDPARFTEEDRRQVRASLGIPPGAPLVTMVARVLRTKGVAEFVAAARDVRQQLPEARFLLVGPHDADSADRFTAAELEDFARVVQLPGSRRDVPRVLSATDVFVLPSFLREGIPRALLEAASMGLPLVTTDSPGCNDVVEDGVNGFLVPLRDPAALGRAILRLLANPELRRSFGRCSRRRAVSQFDLAVIVEQTQEVYRQLLTRPSGRGGARTRTRRRAAWVPT